MAGGVTDVVIVTIQEPSAFVHLLTLGKIVILRLPDEEAPNKREQYNDRQGEKGKKQGHAGQT